jgi:hypothetical protein
MNWHAAWAALRANKAIAKRPLENQSWEQLSEELKKWPNESLNQVQLEVGARQVEATKSIAESSKRLEIGTWILVGTSIVLLVVTVILLRVTAHC